MKLSKATNPHDRLVRSLMANHVLAKQFFQTHLPKKVSANLNFKQMKIENDSYFTEHLEETRSDLVFNCPYQSEVRNPKDHGPDAKLILMVEHQSTPDKLMPFRVFHYMFNMLYRVLKERKKKHQSAKLPSVYALLLYHGKKSPYPYTLNLADCFDDPLGLMEDMFTKPINLIDIQQIPDDDIRRQKWLGLMTGALKYSRSKAPIHYIPLLTVQTNSINFTNQVELQLFRTVIHYFLSVTNMTEGTQTFLQCSQQLPKPARGEVMTIAEELEAIGLKKGIEQGIEQGIEKGREEGIEKGREEVAIKLLKENVELAFVERISGLDMASILALKAKL